MLTKTNHLILLLFCLIGSNAQAQSDLRIIGQMKDVMWKGELAGKINLDTISHKQHLYGLGPVEYLTGEILILNGKSYKSTVLPDGEIKVEESFHIKAPFFGYARVSNWKETSLPDSIQTIAQLETYLDKLEGNASKPFFFKLSGQIEDATIHIVNLPKGTTVKSPQDAHLGQVNYQLTNEAVEILGFFSRNHKTIFTHHDSFLHMHLITADLKKMGHLDKVTLNKGSLKLYLPEDIQIKN